MTCSSRVICRTRLADLGPSMVEFHKQWGRGRQHQPTLGPGLAGSGFSSSTPLLGPEPHWCLLDRGLREAGLSASLTELRVRCGKLPSPFPIHLATTRPMHKHLRELPYPMASCLLSTPAKRIAAGPIRHPSQGTWPRGNRKPVVEMKKYSAEQCQCPNGPAIVLDPILEGLIPPS